MLWIHQDLLDRQHSPSILSRIAVSVPTWLHEMLDLYKMMKTASPTALEEAHPATDPCPHPGCLLFPAFVRLQYSYSSFTIQFDCHHLLLQGFPGTLQFCFHTRPQCRSGPHPPLSHQDTCSMEAPINRGIISVPLDLDIQRLDKELSCGLGQSDQRGGILVLLVLWARGAWGRAGQYSSLDTPHSPGVTATFLLPA